MWHSPVIMPQSYFLSNKVKQFIFLTPGHKQMSAGWVAQLVQQNPVIFTDTLFELSCGEGHLKKILPSLTLCAQSDTNQIIHTQRQTFTLSLFLALAWFGSEGLPWLASDTWGWESLPSFISVWDAPRGLQPGTMCAWRKMAAGKYNSSCNSSLSKCAKSQTRSLTDIIIYNSTATI